MDDFEPAHTRSSRTSRSLTKPEYVPAISSSSASSDGGSSSEEEEQVDGVPVARNPLDPLRRGSVMMQFAGAGATSLGSTLVISLYVTGPPRLADFRTASTAVLFCTLFFGCAATLPSWIAALVILFGKKGNLDGPPPHARMLRLAALIAFFLATIYSVATLALLVVLGTHDSFVSFCMLNLPSTTVADCEDRQNRRWVMGLVVAIVWVFHIALGFPVYRWTRGTRYGKQLKGGILLELGTQPPSFSMALPLNSGDLNKGLKPRRSALSLRSGNTPRINVPDRNVDGARSPTSPAFYSPTSQLGAPSPVVDNFGHFSSLPPSPSIGSTPNGSSPMMRTASGSSVYPTPPGSAPGSARAPSGFDTAVDMSAPAGGDGQAGRSSSILLGEDLGDNPAGSRRPSLILTSAPTEEPQGLAINIDDGHSMPSPLLRSFSGSTSPLNSPTVPFFSTSPVNSPTFGSFPSPILAAGSPTFNSSPSMERVPSSPRLSTLTDPLGRLATGLVRRASNNNLKDELPTSVRPSATRGDSSPTLSTPSLSPLLGGGSGRRSSFAAAAREKEQEKKQELREREARKKADKSHNRMFSFVDRSGDFLGRSKTGASVGWKKRTLFLGVLLVGALFVAYRASGSRGKPTPAASMTRAERQRARLGPRLRRVPNGGSQFIHPDVVERKKAPSSSLIGAPFRWARSLVSSSGPSSSSAVGGQQAKDKKEAKRRSVFVAKKHVEFVDHQALPPPPEHGDQPQRDTLVLYRILGNDLPPRHSPGQTLRNLRFLLQHESDFSVLPPLGPHGVHHSHLYGSGSHVKSAHTQMGGLRVDKYFVLNRIAEPEMVSAIVGLLHLYSVPDSRILIIPFEWSEYQRREFRWDGGVDASTGWSIGDGPQLQQSFGKKVWTPAPDQWTTPSDLSILLEEADGDEARAAAAKKKKSETLGRLRALDFTYHEKNLYAMNNNGGRNFALQHGRSLPNARWILPLDGNSFFTPAAMYSIVRTLSITGEGAAASRYVIIPMARLLDNNQVRKNNSVSLVPLDAVEEGASAIVESEIHHRPAHAPETPEEPQIGFRYDSTETFQEAMRYGRRSKLEFLWRLGAIPYSRGLDRRTLPWEVTDRAHITAATWGSIPGVEGAETKDSIVHQPHGEYDPNGDPNPERGPLAYVKAGWVYRLFSGHKSQEEHNSEAVTLRNTNRIRGIVAFLERLDERVARGEHGCFGEEENPHLCGFNTHRMWNFDQHAVERLRQKNKLGRRDATEKVDRYEQLIAPQVTLVDNLLRHNVVGQLDAQRAATDATLFAMAAYLTGNATYTSLSAQLISERFVKRTPMFYVQADHSEQIRLEANEEGDQPPADDGKDITGYAFPPFPREPKHQSTWSAELGSRLATADAPTLPFDPLSFDPLLLLDALRLLNHPNAPSPDLAKPAAKKAVIPMLNSLLSWLLFSPEALEFSAKPPSAEEGAFYDTKVAALAAFLDDARLLGRVANRARLRLPSANRAEGLLDPAAEVREVHSRLLQGLSNVKLRPYNLLDLDRSGFLGAVHGNETPLDILGL
ncbi:hypothetical protein JCM8097_001237 [Rhodosporidiobolus ruineniae]